MAIAHLWPTRRDAVGSSVTPGARPTVASMSQDKPLRVGVIGCGNISGQYFNNRKDYTTFHITAVADLEPSKAEMAATTHGIERILGVDELLADDSIDIVLNLTIPGAHVPIGVRALRAGKHVYSEKPLAVTLEEAQELIEVAHRCGRRVGCAPDTFLGAGIQTARKLLDEGTIGRPVGFQAFMYTPGHERWHPSPAFYYQPGGGPMMDMGPYYLTALLSLLGPIRRLAGMTSTAIPKRTIGSGPLAGQTIDVQTPDHYVGLIEFEQGASGVIAQSFAVQGADVDGAHPIVIYGTEGALRVPDPNQFDGTVQLNRRGEGFEDVPHAFPIGYGRGAGLADMAEAILTGRAHRCSLELAFSVLEVMSGFRASSDAGRFLEPTHRIERPAPMPTERAFA